MVMLNQFFSCLAVGGFCSRCSCFRFIQTVGKDQPINLEDVDRGTDSLCNKKPGSFQLWKHDCCQHEMASYCPCLLAETDSRGLWNLNSDLRADHSADASCHAKSARISSLTQNWVRGVVCDTAPDRCLFVHIFGPPSARKNDNGFVSVW